MAGRMDWLDQDEYRESSDLREEQLLDAEPIDDPDVDGDQEPDVSHEEIWHKSDPFMRMELSWTWHDLALERVEEERTRLGEGSGM